MNEEKEYKNWEKLEGLRALIKKRFWNYKNICWFANSDGVYFLHKKNLAIPNIEKLLKEIESIYKKITSIQIQNFEDSKTVTQLSFHLCKKIKRNPFNPRCLQTDPKILKEIEQTRIKENMEGKIRVYNRIKNMNPRAKARMFPNADLVGMLDSIKDDKILIEAFEKGIPKEKEKKERFEYRIQQLDEIVLKRLFPNL